MANPKDDGKLWYRGLVPEAAAADAVDNNVASMRNYSGAQLTPEQLANMRTGFDNLTITPEQLADTRVSLNNPPAIRLTPEQLANMREGVDGLSARRLTSGQRADLWNSFDSQFASGGSTTPAAPEPALQSGGGAQRAVNAPAPSATNVEAPVDPKAAMRQKMEQIAADPATKRSSVYANAPFAENEAWPSPQQVEKARQNIAKDLAEPGPGAMQDARSVKAAEEAEQAAVADAAKREAAERIAAGSAEGKIATAGKAVSRTGGLAKRGLYALGAGLLNEYLPHTSNDTALGRATNIGRDVLDTALKDYGLVQVPALGMAATGIGAAAVPFVEGAGAIGSLGHGLYNAYQKYKAGGYGTEADQKAATEALKPKEAWEQPAVATTAPAAPRMLTPEEQQERVNQAREELSWRAYDRRVQEEAASRERANNFFAQSQANEGFQRALGGGTGVSVDPIRNATRVDAIVRGATAAANAAGMDPAEYLSSRIPNGSNNSNYAAAMQILSSDHPMSAAERLIAVAQNTPTRQGNKAQEAATSNALEKAGRGLAAEHSGTQMARQAETERKSDLRYQQSVDAQTSRDHSTAFREWQTAQANVQRIMGQLKGTVVSKEKAELKKELSAAKATRDSLAGAARDMGVAIPEVDKEEDKAEPLPMPNPKDLKKDQIIDTPRGKMKWTGTGLIKA